MGAAYRGDGRGVAVNDLSEDQQFLLQRALEVFAERGTSAPDALIQLGASDEDTAVVLERLEQMSAGVAR